MSKKEEEHAALKREIRLLTENIEVYELNYFRLRDLVNDAATSIKRGLPIADYVIDAFLKWEWKDNGEHIPLHWSQRTTAFSMQHRYAMDPGKYMKFVKVEILRSNGVRETHDVYDELGLGIFPEIEILLNADTLCAIDLGDGRMLVVDPTRARQEDQPVNEVATEIYQASGSPFVFRGDAAIAAAPWRSFSKSEKEQLRARRIEVLQIFKGILKGMEDVSGASKRELPSVSEAGSTLPLEFPE